MLIYKIDVNIYNWKKEPIWRINIVDNLFNKMKEYLNMDSEISFEEFESYYQEMMDNLKENFESYNQDELNKGYYILLNLGSNAMDRAKRKGPLTKKYKKIGEKSQFWADAITHKLKKMGLTQNDINQAYDEISQNV